MYSFVASAAAAPTYSRAPYFSYSFAPYEEENADVYFRNWLHERRTVYEPYYNEQGQQVGMRVVTVLFDVDCDAFPLNWDGPNAASGPVDPFVYDGNRPENQNLQSARTWDNYEGFDSQQQDVWARLPDGTLVPR